MKERKIVMTIEASSNIPIKEFIEKFIQEMFDEHFIDTSGSSKETLIVHRVRVRIVRPEK